MKVVARGSAVERAADQAPRFELEQIGAPAVLIDAIDADSVPCSGEAAAISAESLLATVAHELRGPLSALGLAGERLLRSGDSADREHLSALIVRQVGYMTSLVNELLEAARIRRGTIALEPRPCTLGGVIDAARELAEPLIEARAHALSVRLESASVALLVDPKRLCQVISNLLINAAKYTPPGGRIDVEAWTDGGDVRINVRDNGVGLTAADRHKLFRPFAQLKHGLAAQDGIGLGLALSQVLVRMHGGSLRATSDGPDRGSCFEVRLPLRLPRPTEVPPCGGAQSRAAHA